MKKKEEKDLSDIVNITSGDTNVAKNPERAARLLRAVRRGIKFRKDAEASKKKTEGTDL